MGMSPSVSTGGGGGMIFALGVVPTHLCVKSSPPSVLTFSQSSSDLLCSPQLSTAQISTRI